MFFDNSGNDVASSNPKLVYFHWFYSNYASGTTRSYNAPANNAKYSVSKKLMISYVFEQIQCFQPKSMSQLVKNQLVFMTFLKFIMIYNIENDWFSLVLIAFGEICEIRWKVQKHSEFRKKKTSKKIRNRLTSFTEILISERCDGMIIL